jgi:hypothetical protein
MLSVPAPLWDGLPWKVGQSALTNGNGVRAVARKTRHTIAAALDILFMRISLFVAGMASQLLGEHFSVSVHFEKRSGFQRIHWFGPNGLLDETSQALQIPKFPSPGRKKGPYIHSYSVENAQTEGGWSRVTG